MTETQIPAPSVDLAARCASLKQRATNVALAVQAALPLSKDLPLSAHEAFLLVFSDLRTLEKLFEIPEDTVQYLTPREDAELPAGPLGDFAKELFTLADELAQSLAEQMGVNLDAVLPALVRDMDRQLEMIESIVVRAEANLALVVAKPAEEEYTVPLLCGLPTPDELAGNPEAQSLDIQQHEINRAKDEIFGRE